MQNKRQGFRLIVVAFISGIVGSAVTMFSNQNRSVSNVDTSLTAKNAETKTSNINVDVSTQSSKAYDNIKNAVVTVEAYTKQDSSLEDLIGGNRRDSNSSLSEGSGVIYKKDGQDAFVVTNNHVISGAQDVEVLMYNGKKVGAKVIGHDAISDLAVLKINSNEVTQTATFGNSDSINVGETALAIGSPLGSNYASTLTQGIISAKKRTIDVTDSKGNVTGQASVIQTDAAINSGNSGGPLINLAGQVIGINSMKLSSSAGNATVEGMGFSIPSNEVVQIVNQLAKNGKVSRPALGISLVDLNSVSQKNRKDVLNLPDKVSDGVVIMSINTGSPLKGKLEKYDVITQLGGRKVNDLTTLRNSLYDHKIGDKIEIKFYRNGKEENAKIDLTLEANDANTSAATNEGN